MTLIRINNRGAMEDILRHLDLKLKPLTISILEGDESPCDYGEYIVGLGFTVIQQYIESSYRELKVSRDVAFSLDPKVSDDIGFAELVCAFANYWKHGQEWHSDFEKIGDLNNQAQNNLKKIEKVTPWADYTCSNALAVMLDGRGVEDFEISLLIPLIQEWDENLERLEVL